MKNTAPKLLLIALLTFGLNACGVALVDDAGHLSSLAPKPMFMRGMPEGDDPFSLGFRDGCYNYIGMNGNGYLRFYNRPPNPDDGLLTNQLYQQGYRYGDRQCSVFVDRDVIL